MAGDDEALRMLLVVLLIRFFPICDAGQNGVDLQGKRSREGTPCIPHTSSAIPAP